MNDSATAGPEPVVIDWDSRRLRSLWEIMQPFNPSQFVMLANNMGLLMASTQAAKSTNSIRPEEKCKKDIAALKEWRKKFVELNLQMCALQIDRMTDSLSGPLTDATFGELCDQLSKRMVDECHIKHFLSLSDDEKNLYSPTEPLFGKQVDKAFPSASFEIDEAGKCRALGRNTASVFHLMRLMEICIKAAAACLGVPPPTTGSDRNWGVILKKIKDAVDAKNSAKSWVNPTDKALFADIYASADAVRVAWRNATMHVENKYTAEEAEHIFSAVRALTKKLASRMDENGDPKA